jgi:methylenetetrahydrofolate reductase (NADPH)
MNPLSFPANGHESVKQSVNLPMESRLVRTLLNGEFAVTAEITPPTSCDPKELLDKAEPLRGWVDAVNVTDGASARVAMSSLAAAALLVRNGIEPVLQVTCRDRNRIALQSDLLGAAALGIHNLLILRGDDPTAGDQPDAKPVFDWESRDLIVAASRMRDDGVMPSGCSLDSAPKFFIGAADTPTDPPQDWWPEGLDGKAKAGTQFVQTQLCYDIEVVRRYIARLSDLGLTDRLFILIGIGPLPSARSARWMRDNLWGVAMPDEIIDRLDKAADSKREGIQICAELLQQLSEIPGVSGAHLMAPLQTDGIPAALEQSGVLAQRTAPAPW